MTNDMTKGNPLKIFIYFIFKFMVYRHYNFKNIKE